MTLFYATDELQSVFFSVNGGEEREIKIAGNNKMK